MQIVSIFHSNFHHFIQVLNISDIINIDSTDTVIDSLYTLFETMYHKTYTGLIIPVENNYRFKLCIVLEAAEIGSNKGIILNIVFFLPIFHYYSSRLQVIIQAVS